MPKYRSLKSTGWWSVLALVLVMHACGGVNANGDNSACTSDRECTVGGRCEGGRCRSTQSPSDGGKQDGSNGSSCDALSSAAQSTIEDAFLQASGHLECTTDADCVIANGGSNCTNACRNEVVSTSGAQMVQTAIDRVTADACKTFVDQGCSVLQPPCGPGPLSAACVNGACTAFAPADWISFAVDEGRGGDSTYFSTPPKCTTGHDCTLWKVHPDGSIEKSTSGVPSTAKLSAVDFTTLDGILRSQSFRQAFAGQMPTCDAPPTGIRVSFDLENRFVLKGYDVTGCTISGPAGNEMMRIYDLVRAY